LASAKLELQKEASDRASLTEGHRAELEKRNGDIAKLTEQLVDAESDLGKAAQELAVERKNAQRLNQGPILPNVASAE
jgi:hypothetical protein